jgi:hypothetical protein
MRLPVRLIRGRFPVAWERRAPRLFRVDPRVLLDPEPAAEDFRAAMSIIHVGSTIKITGADRHGAADELLLAHLDLTDAHILDIGASDGSTSVDLVAKLPDFASYTISDRYLQITAVTWGRWTAFLDDEDRCILLAGRHLLAWPSLSRFVRWAFSPLIALARRGHGTSVLLLGPGARTLLREDPRVVCRVHDIFRPWPGRAPDVIKVANVLRRMYFSDRDIERALDALFAGLDEGGHLLIVDNPRIPGIPVRGGLYRRGRRRFEPVARTEHPAEIDDLVARFESDCSVSAGSRGGTVRRTAVHASSAVPSDDPSA